MALAMARPYRHPRSGVYYFRRRVPAHLAGHFGRAVEKRSLGTRDPSEARIRFAEVAAEFDALWRETSEMLARRAAPRTPRELSHREIHAIAGEVYRAVVAANEEEPGDAARWEGALRADQWMKPPAERAPETPPVPPLILFGHRAHGPRRAAPYLAPILQRLGVEPVGESRTRLVRATAGALEQAHDRLRRAAVGDYSADPHETRFPPPVSAAQARPAPLVFEEVREKWRTGARLSHNTCKRWFPIVEKLLVHAKTADLRAVTEAHVRSWIDALAQEGLRDKTIRNNNLAAVKALCNWLKEVRLLDANPAADIRIRIKETGGNQERFRGLTFAEAGAILRASLAPQPDKVSEGMRAARRWLPWLLAYTGARINELTQLRKADVVMRRVPGRQDVAVIVVDPAAGTVKGNLRREVALHPHILEQGFLEFVAGLRRERLFYDEDERRAASRTAHYELLGQEFGDWVRGIGVDDPRIRPNHAWRHRFKNLCIEVGMPEVVSKWIMGHAAGSVSEKYGDKWPGVMLDNLARIDAYRRLDEDRP